jgi:hypothetical protein
VAIDLKSMVRPAVFVAGMAVAMVALAQDQNATSALMTAPSPEILPRAEVDWKAVSDFYARSQPPRMPYSRIKGFLAERKGLDILEIPVLLPGSGDTLPMQEARLVSLGEVYDVVVQPADQPGLTVTFSGTRVMSEALPGSLSRQKAQTVATLAGPERVLIDALENGWSASFVRFGVLYSVDLTCASDETAHWCADDSRIRHLVAASTEIVLGETAETAMNRAGFKLSRNPPPQVQTETTPGARAPLNRAVAAAAKTLSKEQMAALQRARAAKAAEDANNQIPR